MNMSDSNIGMAQSKQRDEHAQDLHGPILTLTNVGRAATCNQQLAMHARMGPTMLFDLVIITL